MADSTPHRTTTDLIWSGVEAGPEVIARLEPAWDLLDHVAIKADIGHHHRAPEVVEHSLACIEAGACAVHLHIRDDEGDSGDLGLWRDVIGQIKAAHPDVVIDSGLRGRTLEERLLHLREELFDVVPIIPTWDPAYMREPLKEMHDRGIRPEFCIWDGTDITLAKHLLDDGLVERPGMWLVVPSTPYYGLPMPSPALAARGALHLLELIQAADPEAHVSFSAVGRPSSFLTTFGMLLGHHVRPGIGETSWRWPHGHEVAHDPAVLIADAAAVASAFGRRPATSLEYRALIRR